MKKIKLAIIPALILSGSLYAGEATFLKIDKPHTEKTFCDKKHKMKKHEHKCKHENKHKQKSKVLIKYKQVSEDESISQELFLTEDVSTLV